MNDMRQNDPAYLLTAHQRRIMGYLRTLIPARNDAEEVLQEVNLYLCMHADEFQPGTNYAAWALRVAHYCACTWRGRQKRDRLVFDDALVERLAESGVRANADENRQLQALRTCMQKLKTDEHKMITGYYRELGTAPAAAIADELGVSPSGIYVLLKRVRLKLRECIERTLAAEEHPKGKLPEEEKDEG